MASEICIVFDSNKSFAGFVASIVDGYKSHHCTALASLLFG